MFESSPLINLELTRGLRIHKFYLPFFLRVSWLGALHGGFGGARSCHLPPKKVAGSQRSQTKRLYSGGSKGGMKVGGLKDP